MFSSLLQKITKIQVPVNSIDAVGRTEIEKLLYDDYNLPTLPLNWHWVWKIDGKGEYVGTFPKRVAKFMYKQGCKLDNEILEKLGNIVSRFSSRHDTFYIDFTKKFNWYPGDFGDNGSCFWENGEGGHTLRLLENKGALAIRFYRNYTPNSGYARAWVFPISKKTHVIFNAYGLHLLSVARILSYHLGLTYKKVCLYGDDIYINGGAQYVIGHPSYLGKISIGQIIDLPTNFQFE